MSHDQTVQAALHVMQTVRRVHHVAHAASAVAAHAAAVAAAAPVADPALAGTARPTQIMSADMKPAEVEVAVVRAGERFVQLSDAEVEAHLTALAERD